MEEHEKEGMYVCRECGKTSPEPAMCHGQPMEKQKKATYKCEACGFTSEESGEHCGMPMARDEEERK